MVLIIYFTIGDQDLLKTFGWYCLYEILVFAVFFFSGMFMAKQEPVIVTKAASTLEEAKIVITDVSKNIIFKYQGKDFPDWIELNNSMFYDYSGLAPIVNGKIDYTKFEKGTFVTGDGVVYVKRVSPEIKTPVVTQ